MSLFGGIGKMLSGGNLLGSLFDKIGMPWLGKIVNVALDIYTGNMAALVGDVANLASQFKGLGFLDKVAQFAPLGGFAMGGGFGSSSFGSSGFGMSSDRLGDLSSVASSSSRALPKFSNAVGVIRQTAQATEMYNTTRNAHHYGRMAS